MKRSGAAAAAEDEEMKALVALHNKKFRAAQSAPAYVPALSVKETRKWEVGQSIQQSSTHPPIYPCRKASILSFIHSFIHLNSIHSSIHSRIYLIQHSST